IPFRAGAADREAIEFIHEVLGQVTPSYRRPPVIPFSCLVDRHGQVAVIYRGPVTAAQVLADAALVDMDPVAVRSRVAPVTGRWLNPPIPPKSIAVAGELLSNGHPARARTYIEHIFNAPRGEGPYALSETQRGDAAFALASFMLEESRFEEAVRYSRSAVKFTPDDPRAHTNLGVALLSLGDASGAIRHLSDALDLQADLTVALLNRGQAHLRTNDGKAALRDFERVLELQPGNDQLRAQTALLWFQGGVDERAIRHLRYLVKKQPDSLQITGVLSWILATSPDPAVRRSEEARQLALRWVRGTGSRDHQALNGLAAAQAETGDFPGAVQNMTRAIELLGAAGDPQVLQTYRERLALYEAGRPFHRTK
ncbi:MAG: tetratricopeptide repeat protein, partial [Akkermansiaceae bacterium]|nr:tetratricopeptide repeat protein [Akkermansiaceae bacterium]